MTKIGIQGDLGSFSEEAANDFVKRHDLADVKLEYLISSKRVLEAVEDRSVDYGIFAIENSQGGVVIESIEALAAHRCDIVEMFHILIHQNLLALPGMTVGEIKSIHSHQQALRQCREYLEEKFKDTPQLEEADTAESARLLHTGKLPKTSAVIANKNCAKLYELDILEPQIEDMKNNITLFIAIKVLS